MQKLCVYKALYSPEFHCKCHKDSPLKEWLLKTFVLQQIFASIDLIIFDLESFIHIFSNDIVNEINTEVQIYYIIM